MGNTCAAASMVRHAKDGNIEGMARIQAERDLDVNTLTEHGVDIPGDTIRCNPLFAACVTGQLEAIDWLLSHGADATVPSEYGYTPLHAGAYRNQVAVIELLFDKATKLDIDAVDEFGDTALHVASRLGHQEAADVLLERGADPHFEGFHERNPRQRAVELGHDHVVDVIDAHIERRASEQDLALLVAEGVADAEDEKPGGGRTAADSEKGDEGDNGGEAGDGGKGGQAPPPSYSAEARQGGSGKAEIALPGHRHVGHTAETCPHAAAARVSGTHEAASKGLMGTQAMNARLRQENQFLREDNVTLSRRVTLLEKRLATVTTELNVMREYLQ